MDVRFLNVVIIPAALCGGIAWMTSRTDQNVDAKPTIAISGSVLSVDASELNVGAVCAVPDFVHVLTLRNSGKDTIAVHEFRASCRCTDVSPPSVSLLPGHSVDVQLKLDLTRLGNRNRTFDPIPFSVTVQPIADFGVHTDPWEISGHVKFPIHADSYHLQFGQVVIDSSPAPRQVTRLLSDRPLNNVRAESESAAFKATILGTSADGREHLLAVDHQSDGEVCGPHSFRVSVSGKADNGVEVGCQVVDCSVAFVHNVAPVSRVIFLENRDRVISGSEVLRSADGSGFEVMGHVDQQIVPSGQESRIPLELAIHRDSRSDARLTVSASVPTTVRRSRWRLLVSVREDGSGREYQVPVDVHRIATARRPDQ